MINILRGGEWVEDQLDDPIPLQAILYLERTPNVTPFSSSPSRNYETIISPIDSSSILIARLALEYPSPPRDRDIRVTLPEMLSRSSGVRTKRKDDPGE